MDFVSDTAGRRKVQLLTLVGCGSRECPAIEVDTSIGGARVGRVLDRLFEERTSNTRQLDLPVRFYRAPGYTLWRSIEMLDLLDRRVYRYTAT